MTRPVKDRYQRSGNALSRRVGPNVLVTKVADESVQELSGGATAVWEELQSPRDVATLVDRIASSHRMPPSEIAALIEECVGSLVQLGVVEEEVNLDA